MLKSVTLSLASLAAALGLAWGAAAAPPVAGSVGDFSLFDPPRPAPAQPFEDAAGGAVGLAQFRGRVLLVNLWATWCAPCVEELPTLDRLEGRLGSADFEVLAVSLDREVATVEAFYREHGIQNLRVYRDPLLRLTTAFVIEGLPSTFLVDREGNVVGVLSGPAAWDTPEAEALVRYYLERR